MVRTNMSPKPPMDHLLPVIFVIQSISVNDRPLVKMPDIVALECS